MKQPVPNILKTKKRSLRVEDVSLPIYIPGERVGPKDFKTNDLNDIDVMKTHYRKILFG